MKDTIKLVMETIPFPEGKSKKLEGRTGALYLKANGGKQAVEIHDESLVPDELCTVTVTFPSALWNVLVYRVKEMIPTLPDPERAKAIFSEMKVSPRVPSLSLIAERLTGACKICGGSGGVNSHHEEPKAACPECGGSGRQSVPGARFAERGNHVEVR